MRVKELIEKLKEYPENMKVEVMTADPNGYDGWEVDWDIMKVTDLEKVDGKLYIGRDLD